MSFFDDVRRRALSSRAAQYLRDKDAEWTTGYWIMDPETEDNIESANTMGSIRGWLRERGFNSPYANKRFNPNVCAEGALLLALAQDESIPDDANGARLLEEFQDDARLSAVYNGFILDEGDFETIPDLNDDRGLDRDMVIQLLDRMSTQ